MNNHPNDVEFFSFTLLEQRPARLTKQLLLYDTPMNTTATTTTTHTHKSGLAECLLLQLRQKL